MLVSGASYLTLGGLNYLPSVDSASLNSFCVDKCRSLLEFPTMEEKNVDTILPSAHSVDSAHSLA